MVSHRLADLSRVLFKNAYVLPVAATMLSFSDGRFTKHQVAAVLRVSDNLVSTPASRFLDAGFLKEVGLVDAEGRHLQIVDGPFWEFVGRL